MNEIGQWIFGAKFEIEGALKAKKIKKLWIIKRRASLNNNRVEAKRKSKEIKRFENGAVTSLGIWIKSGVATPPRRPWNIMWPPPCLFSHLLWPLDGLRSCSCQSLTPFFRILPDSFGCSAARRGFSALTLPVAHSFLSNPVSAYIFIFFTIILCADSYYAFIK